MLWVMVWVLAAVLAFVVLAGGVFFLGMRNKWAFVQNAVRRMNRRFMNPRQLRTAGRPGAYASVIHHVGRTSGTRYTTPVVPFPTEDGFVIALPYGTKPDWVKNVLTTREATLDTEGATHQLVQATLVDTLTISRYLPEKEQRDLGLFRVHQALRFVAAS